MTTPGARLYETTNPDSPRHWSKVAYLDRAHELNLRTWHFKPADNPSLSAEYAADLTAAYVGLWRRRMTDGAWPPPQWAPYYDAMRVDDAWYSGDRQRLARVYGNHTRRTERRRLWGLA